MLRHKAIETAQFGAEATAGTEVPGGEQFLGLTKFNLKGMEPKTQYRGVGSETSNGESQEKVHSEFDGEGPVCYMTLPRFLNACLGYQAASPYTWKPSNFGVDTLKTLSVQKGSAAGAEKAAYGVVKGFKLRFVQKDTSFNFTGFARKLTTGSTLTATPTKVPCIPLDPKKVDLYLGVDEGGLAVTKWQEMEVTVADRWAPHFEGNGTDESFEEPAKVANEHTIQLTLTSAAAIADLIAAARAKELRCIRIKATSALEFAAGEFYDFQLTAMCRVQMPDTSGEAENAVATTVNLVMAYDADFDGFMELILTNA